MKHHSTPGTCGTSSPRFPPCSCCSRRLLAPQDQGTRPPRPHRPTCVRSGWHGAHHPRGAGAADDQPGGAEVHLAADADRRPEPTLAERRAATDKFRIGRAEEARKLYPVDIKEQTIGGVRCDVIKPLNIPAAKRDRVLINVHGGGFNATRVRSWREFPSPTSPRQPWFPFTTDWRRKTRSPPRWTTRWRFSRNC